MRVIYRSSSLSPTSDTLHLLAEPKLKRVCGSSFDTGPMPLRISWQATCALYFLNRDRQIGNFHVQTLLLQVQSASLSFRNCSGNINQRLWVLSNMQCLDDFACCGVDDIQSIRFLKYDLDASIVRAGPYSVVANTAMFDGINLNWGFTI